MVQVVKQRKQLPEEGSREIRTLHPLLRWGLLVTGLVSTGLGILGAFLPILPTTPFLLLAAGCFVRSSSRLYAWLLNHRRLGPMVKRIRSGRGLTLSTKLLSTAAAALLLGLFAVFGTESLALRLILAGVLAVKILVMVVIPTDRGGAAPAGSHAAGPGAKGASSPEERPAPELRTNRSSGPVGEA